MYGDVDEKNPFNPTTMYGVSKLSAHWIVKNYRDVHGLFVCSGILFNHESPRRGETFVTQKIIRGLKSGVCISLGNLDARRDWGHAEDYVEAMWIMLQQKQPSDYVVSTGKSYSVREFIQIAVEKLGTHITWESDDTMGKIDGKVMIRVSQEFFRPRDTRVVVGDPTELESLGWKRKHDIHSLIEDMLFPREEILQDSNTSK
jgi:GDPmannose 4,6-dehydratase